MKWFQDLRKVRRPCPFLELIPVGFSFMVRVRAYMDAQQH
jgi:hypothetical protein